MRAVLWLGLLGAAPAMAADVDLFYPSGSIVHSTGTLQGESPTLGRKGVSVGLMSWLAQDLAVAEYDDGSTESLIGSLFAMPLYGAYTIGDKARIEVLVPLYLYTDVGFSGFQGAALGDVELRALVPLWSPNEHFGLALKPGLGFPTGTEDAALKEGFSGALTVVTGGTIIPSVGWVANLGVRGKEAATLEDVTLGSTFDLLAGTWWEAQPGFRIGAEVNWSQGLAKADDATGNALLTAHGLAQITSPSGLGLAIGVGSGVGVGAPAWRVFAALTWAPAVKDSDHDGVPDATDGCPDEEEDLDEYVDTDGCPEADNDGDGMLDGDDLCPIEAEDPDDFSDLDGCPDLDNDEDLVADVDDACPDLVGAVADRGCPDSDADGVFDDADACLDLPGPAATVGCPDADADLVPDSRDECKDEPRNIEADPEYSSGCPEIAFVTADGVIKITQKVNFDEGTARIRPDGKLVLDEVAQIMADYPEIDLLEVGGHTDDTGNPDANLTLSKQRAESVAIYLTEKGVSSKRLMPKGYGQGTPVDTNRTTAGRANNRRIEFTIRRWVGGEGPTAPAPAGKPPAPETPAPEPTEDPVWH